MANRRCQGRQVTIKVGKVARRHADVFWADYSVNESDGEREALWVLQHAGQLFACLVGRDLGRLIEPVLH